MHVCLFPLMVLGSEFIGKLDCARKLALTGR